MKRKTQKVNKADWKEFCGGCSAALTECDRGAEQCTNCKRPLPRLDVFQQHVHVQGYPQIVVTRLFYYQWLKKHGLRNPNEMARGFDSLDYAAFGRPSTDAPLTEEKDRDQELRFLAKELKKAGYRRMLQPQMANVVA